MEYKYNFIRVLFYFCNFIYFYYLDLKRGNKLLLLSIDCTLYEMYYVIMSYVNEQIKLKIVSMTFDKRKFRFKNIFEINPGGLEERFLN